MLTATNEQQVPLLASTKRHLYQPLPSRQHNKAMRSVYLLQWMSTKRNSKPSLLRHRSVLLWSFLPRVFGGLVDYNSVPAYDCCVSYCRCSLDGFGHDWWAATPLSLLLLLWLLMPFWGVCVASLVDAITREVTSSIFITHIYYVTKVVAKKDKYFVVIYKDEQLKRRSCSLFLLDKDEAMHICDKVKEAFRVAKEDVKAREGNPFMPFSAEAQPITGGLASVQIPRRSLTAVKALGAGQFGEVYLANQEIAAGTTELRAVKMLRGGATAADKAEFIAEAEIMQPLQHTNLVQLAGVCAQRRPWLVVLEFCQNGDLLGALKTVRDRKQDVSTTEQVRIAKEIAQGLDFVAKQRIIHLDVAARNILLDAKGTAKVADFGLAQPFDEGKPHFRLRKTLKLSIRWVAVEALRPPPKLLSEKSDVWSFGVTLWEMFTLGAMPYRSYRLHELQRLVVKGLRLEKPPACPDNIFALMSSCWMKNPDERPSFEALATQLNDLEKEMPAPAVTLVSMLETDAAEAGESGSSGMDNLESLLKQYDLPEV
eukprot:m.233162 g.233162  ORF g.233162 m.233162 type:complete len:540 (-) comp15244_c0_seq1:273-1892(-)